MCPSPPRLPPATRAWIAVGIGIPGISLAAPIGAATAAPALAVAFWRSAGGALATVPLLGVRARRRSGGGGGFRGLGRPGWSGCLGAGALLAVHFALWLPSLRLTSVTASTALVTTTPVWTVLLGRIWGAAVPGAWAGVGLALAGVLTVTGIDAGHGRAALVGDVLALAGGMASAGYVLVGERMRRTTSTAVYTLVAYATCAVLLLPLCAVSGTPLTGWGWRTWIELLVLTFAAQLLGHSLLNAALPVIGATALSLSILLEVPGAAVVAWLWLGSAPPWTVVPGAALVLAGLVAVIRAGRRRPSGCLRQVRPARISRAGRPVFGGELPYSAGNFRPPIESRWFGDIRHGWFGGVRYGEALIRGWRRAPAGLNSREPSMSQGRRCRPRPCRDRSGSS